MDRPNFVLIMTDTQGANVVGCYGNPALQTPCIDRLAGDGIRFNRAYTTCPLCSPARSGIFTGLYPSVNGVVTNNLAQGANIVDMGRRFKDAGYRTAYTGKWHLDGLDYFDSGVCPPQWEDETWYDGRRYLSDLDDRQTALWRQGLRSEAALRANQIDAAFTWAHRCSDRAIRFLQESGDQPFLLVVSYDEPHGPFVCPPEYIERFQNFAFPIGPSAQDDLSGKPAYQREWAASLNAYQQDGFYRHPLYFGCNSFVDSEIGRVIAAVDQFSPENTCVIYTSDHGDMFGAHRLTGKGPVMYDEITRIPLIIRQPGKLNAGAVDERVVSQIDILPTLLNLAGMEISPVLNGAPLPLALSDPYDRAALIEFTRFSINHDGWGGYQPVRCLVKDRYKLVINLLDSDELYDLQSDPAEMLNLIETPEYVSVRNEMHDALLARLDDVRDPYRGPCWERRAWRKERKQKWNGGYRHRPPDGYQPVTLAYETGKPPAQWVEPLR